MTCAVWIRKLYGKNSIVWMYISFAIATSQQKNSTITTSVCSVVPVGAYDSVRYQSLLWCKSKKLIWKTWMKNMRQRLFAVEKGARPCSDSLSFRGKKWLLLLRIIILHHHSAMNIRLIWIRFPRHHPIRYGYLIPTFNYAIYCTISFCVRRTQLGIELDIHVFIPHFDMYAQAAAHTRTQTTCIEPTTMIHRFTFPFEVRPAHEHTTELLTVDSWLHNLFQFSAHHVQVSIKHVWRKFLAWAHGRSILTGCEQKLFHTGKNEIGKLRNNHGLNYS